MSTDLTNTKISKEEVNNLLYMAQQLEQEASKYQQQIDLLNGYYNDLTSAEQTLKELKLCASDHSVLVPIGGGCFIYAKVPTTDSVIVSVGARIHVEKTTQDAIDSVIKKKEVIQNQITQIKASYNEVIDRLQKINQLLKTMT